MVDPLIRFRGLGLAIQEEDLFLTWQEGESGAWVVCCEREGDGERESACVSARALFVSIPFLSVSLFTLPNGPESTSSTDWKSDLPEWRTALTRMDHFRSSWISSSSCWGGAGRGEREGRERHDEGGEPRGRGRGEGRRRVFFLSQPFLRVRDAGEHRRPRPNARHWSAWSFAPGPAEKAPAWGGQGVRPGAFSRPLWLGAARPAAAAPSALPSAPPPSLSQFHHAPISRRQPPRTPSRARRAVDRRFSRIKKGRGVTGEWGARLSLFFFFFFFRCRGWL